MMGSATRKIAAALLGAIASVGVFSQAAQAADHGDAPLVAGDQGIDTNDLYVFLDPNDNTKLVIIFTFRGFIVSGEAANFGIFDPLVRYRIAIENTGDAVPDMDYEIRFSPKVSAAEAQIARVTFPDGERAQFPCTNSVVAAAPPPQVVTSRRGLEVFAGMVDDPFFFDIPAFARFVASVRAGSPDTSLLTRGRDSFAGYNTMCIAFRTDVANLKGEGDTIGVAAFAERREQVRNRDGTSRLSGKWRALDRVATPAVNVALIPFGRKDEHNASTPQQDAAGKFVNDILGTLALFGTDSTSIGILASLAVTNGDYVRVNTTTPNSGPGGGGDDGGEGGFPNGRRLRDDVVDIELFVINNRQALGDNVNGNDIVLQNQFPFVALPQQPRNPGTNAADDNTRN